MEEALVKRIMPNSLEAEQSVIGSMIMDKDAIVTAMEMLISEDFYHTQYGILFDTMIELYNKGLPVDLVTLQNKLKEKDVPPEIASLEFVRDLVTAVPTSANVKYYAQIVKDNSMRRKLIKLNEEIENECYVGKESVETVMDITEKKVFDLLSTRGGGGDYVPIRQVVMNALEKIEFTSVPISLAFESLKFITLSIAIFPVLLYSSSLIIFPRILSIYFSASLFLFFTIAPIANK